MQATPPLARPTTCLAPQEAVCSRTGTQALTWHQQTSWATQACRPTRIWRVAKDTHFINKWWACTDTSKMALHYLSWQSLRILILKISAQILWSPQFQTRAAFLKARWCHNLTSRPIKMATTRHLAQLPHLQEVYILTIGKWWPTTMESWPHTILVGVILLIKMADLWWTSRRLSHLKAHPWPIKTGHCRRWAVSSLVKRSSLRSTLRSSSSSVVLASSRAKRVKTSICH